MQREKGVIRIHSWLGWNVSNHFCSLVARSLAIAHIACESSVSLVWRAHGITHLDCFLALQLNVSAAYPGAHILHDDRPWAAIDKDAAMPSVALEKRHFLPSTSRQR